MKPGNVVGGDSKVFRNQKEKENLRNFSDTLQYERDGARDSMNMMKHFPDHKYPWEQRAVV